MEKCLPLCVPGGELLVSGSQTELGFEKLQILTLTKALSSDSSQQQ